jgi:nucleotide-binding universal stress UspA family protein
VEKRIFLLDLTLRGRGIKRMRVLIGYDGSASADAAIEDLKWAGLPRECEVLVFAVADLLASNPAAAEIAEQVLLPRRVVAGLQEAQTYGERVVNEAKSFVSKAKYQVQNLFPEWDVKDKVIEGSPIWELLDLAQEWKADLVVVGSEGRSAIRRFLLGSVSRKLATDAHCSVRVARPGTREDTDISPPRIIIGVDNSPTSVQAIYSVGQRVWQEGTEVRLISVDDDISTNRIAYQVPQAAAMINSSQQKRKSRIQSILEWGEEELNIIGIKTTLEIKKGEPAQVLIDEALKWNADSIFVGTRNLNNFFERFRLGSVSTGVVTKANCSVEIVRPSENTEG